MDLLNKRHMKAGLYLYLSCILLLEANSRETIDGEKTKEEIPKREVIHGVSSQDESLNIKQSLATNELNGNGMDNKIKDADVKNVFQSEDLTDSSKEDISVDSPQEEQTRENVALTHSTNTEDQKSDTDHVSEDNSKFDTQQESPLATNVDELQTKADTENTPTNTEDQNSSFFSNILQTIVGEYDKGVEFSEEKLSQNLTNDTIEDSTNVTVATGIDNGSNITNITSDIENEIEKISNNSNSDKNVKFQCVGRNLTDSNVEGVVKIVNNTGLLNLLNFEKNDTECDCVVVLFFAPWCPFCAQIAPNYNALARVFPQLEVVAVDAAQFSNLNARFGTVLVPNILLFHQSRSAVRYNQTDKSLDSLIKFVQNTTGLEGNLTVNVTSEDYVGPLLSVVTTENPDYLLYIAWVFVIVFLSVIFVQSTYGQQSINKMRLLWHEHQHID